MPLTLAQAAESTGTNRTTILRAIKAGKLSGSRDAHGQWQIEAAELHRVYPPAEVRTQGERSNLHYRAQIAEAEQSAQIASLRDMAELLRAQLDDVRRDRDHWRDQAQAVTRQLADQTAKPAPAEAPRRRWWQRRAG